jgi:hypothetical protein
LIAEIRVFSGPAFSSVEFRFSDKSKTKIANVRHKSAEPMALFTTEGLAAFDRYLQDPKVITDFFYACNHGLPLPAELFEKN